MPLQEQTNQFFSAHQLIIKNPLLIQIFLPELHVRVIPLSRKICLETITIMIYLTPKIIKGKITTDIRATFDLEWLFDMTTLMKGPCAAVVLKHHLLL